MKLISLVKISAGAILLMQQLPVFSQSMINAELQSELDAMVSDELILKYRPKLALKNKLISKYKTSRTATVKVDKELNREIISSVADYYHLPVDESAPENNGFSRLSNPSVYNEPSSPLSSMRVTNHDGSTFSVIKLRGKISKLKLRRMIARMDSERLNNPDFEVLAVYPNYIFKISETPDDPSYSSQDALEQINVSEAWSESQGEGVVVAVIDTGVDYQHKDLADNIWVNTDEIAGNGKDDDNNGYIDDVRGWDFVKQAGLSCLANEDCRHRDNDPSDVNGHGTHVAGTIAAVQNNDFGITGVAPKAKIMPLRAAYSAGYTAFLKSSDIAEAVEYAIRNGADVINMSFAGTKLGMLEDVLKRAQDLGVVVVAAAGNTGSNDPTYPAALDDVIAVGSVDDNGYQTQFTNYGSWVDISAPGVAILSTAPGDGFARKTGTSMSAPLVSGVAALVISKSKELHLSPDQVRERIVSSSTEGEASALSMSSSRPGQLNADINYPLQVDDMELPRIAGLSQSVEFYGTGSENKKAAANYEWTSNVDGLLSHEAKFAIASLSPGNHKITLRVQSESGTWSQPVSKDLTIDAERRLFSQSEDEIAAHIIRRDQHLIAALPQADRDTVEEYIWTSNKDGELPSTRTIPITELSPGLHRITLVVHDKRGFFTAPIERVVDIKS